MIFESAASSYPVSPKANVISEEKVLRCITYLSLPCLCYQLRCNTLTFELEKKIVNQEIEGYVRRQKEKKEKHKQVDVECCYKF